MASHASREPSALPERSTPDQGKTYPQAPDASLQAYVDRSPRMAAQRHVIQTVFGRPYRGPVEGHTAQRHRPATEAVAQRAVGFEFQTYNDSTKLEIRPPPVSTEASSSQAVGGQASSSSSSSQAIGGQASSSQASNALSASVDAPWVPYSLDVEERYAQGGGIKVEKDGPDLEFVTNAFPESDSGRAALTQALRTILLTALSLEKQNTLTSDIARRGPGLSPGTHASDDVRVKSNGPMKAQVQASVGVRLESLSRLISLLGQAPKRESNDNLRALFDAEVARPDARNNGPLKKPKNTLKQGSEMAYTLAQELGNNTGNATQKTLVKAYQRAGAFAGRVMSGLPDEGGRLHSIVHLIGLYIFGSTSKANYAKARTPVMSRTNLADAIFSLSPRLIAAFSNVVIPNIANVLGTDKIEMTRTLYQDFPLGDKTAMGLTQEDSNAITIETWLNGLKPVNGDGDGDDDGDGDGDAHVGEDQTGRYDGFAVIDNWNRDHPDADEYRSKWFAGEYGQRMESSTDIGQRETVEGDLPRLGANMEGLVVELRNLGNDNLDLSEWATFALSLFDLVLLVNSSSIEEEAALAQSMRAQRTFETDLGDVDLPGIFQGARAILARL